MRLTKLWKSTARPTVSFEVFPARTPKAADKLGEVIDELVALHPDFMSVTFGAGGSTRDGSRQLVDTLSREKHVPLLAYFAGYGLGPEDIVSVLDGYRELGVESILAVRGDPPKEPGEFVPHPKAFPHASDLLAFLRARYDFCLGAAGYPETHVEAASQASDLGYLKLKVEEGAEFVVANYAYDNDFFFDFVARCRAAGIDVPILPGVMPVYSVKMMETLAGVCGATITPALRAGLAGLPEGDKDAVQRFGIEFATEQCRGLLAAGVPGLHFYTMDRSQSVAGVLGALRAERLL